MLRLVLTCALVIHGVLGYPPGGGIFWSNNPIVESRSVAMPRNYFSNFDVETLNPLNWIGNRNAVESRSESDIKFEALFKIADCLTHKEAKECAKLVEDIRPSFEKIKATTSKPATPTTATKLTT